MECLKSKKNANENMIFFNVSFGSMLCQVQ